MSTFRLTDKDASELESGTSLYKKSADSLSALWHYGDDESGILRAWFCVGTYPYAEDVAPLTEVNISPSLQSSLPLSTIIPNTEGNNKLV